MTLSLLVCLAGLIIWFVCSIPREKKGWVEGWAAEVGKLCFFCGLLSYLLNVGTKVMF